MKKHRGGTLEDHLVPADQQERVVVGKKNKKTKKPGGSEGTLVAPRPPHQVALPHQECDTVPSGDTATRRAGGL